MPFLALLLIVVILNYFQPDETLIRFNGELFSGEAQFKFVIHENDQVIWSNDGTSIKGEEPNTSVCLFVDQGRYKVNLGEEPMLPLYYELFNIYPDASLKTWVKLDDHFELFSVQELNTKKIVSYLDKIDEDKALKRKEKSKNPPSLVRNKKVIEEKKNKSREYKEATNADGWSEQRFMQRANEDGIIPFEALMKAKNQLVKMPEPKDAGLWKWEWLGPGNLGGRIRAMAIHPTIPSRIWIGSVSRNMASN